MIEALGYLSILEHARKELNGTKNINIFKVDSHGCNRYQLSFKNCCFSSGWGMKLGLAHCDQDSKILAKERGSGKCIKVGTYCTERPPLLKTCIRKKTVFCCFGSKFAKLLQEQGKKQLGLDFGSAKYPQCGQIAEDLRQKNCKKSILQNWI